MTDSRVWVWVEGEVPHRVTVVDGDLRMERWLLRPDGAWERILESRPVSGQSARGRYREGT